MKKLALILVLLLLATPFASADPLEYLGLDPAGSYDLGGNTVTIISWAGARMEQYFDSFIPVIGRIEEAEELFNCKIEFMQTSNVPRLNQIRVMAGDSAYDLWHVQNKIGYFELVSAGAALPMGDLLPTEYYENLPPTLRMTEDALKFGGKYYGIGTMDHNPTYGFQNDLIFVAYNKTLLEREGIEDIHELYLNDEWTWDKVTEIGRKVTRDIDGDGEIDQYGISDVRPWDLAIANDAALTKLDADGRVVYAGDEPAYIEAINQYLDWWHNDQIAFPTRNNQDSLSKFVNGEAAFFFYVPVFRLPDLMEQMSDEWGFVPFPKGPNADDYRYPSQALSTTLVPVNAAQPEALVALRAFLWQEEDITRNIVLANVAPNRESAQVFMEAHEYWNGSASRLFEIPTWDATSVINYEILEGEIGPTAGMAKVRPVIQANLDELLGQ